MKIDSTITQTALEAKGRDCCPMCYDPPKIETRSDSVREEIEMEEPKIEPKNEPQIEQAVPPQIEQPIPPQIETEI